MLSEPLLVGGHNRLDSELMSGKFTHELSIVAKEGADGLLGVGVAPNDRYKSGLGILIKLSSGYNSAYLEKVIVYILRQCGLMVPATLDSKAHLDTRFHFSLAAQAN
jgi:L-asparaginase II